ncbi:CpsD/CapB family tyrosine-protein kinase [Algicella marina]|uniref:non-specific protein-tyrosine kinase n=1 Tax=Algicella marina TaxID=2683284 RepID=A0A6P1T7Q9_9RHOB|nr:CpsD/CapB family tyrosine-protein kinase [Algicella marina]QHQ36622.1 AAA family ATPase [Algicella marina]
MTENRELQLAGRASFLLFLVVNKWRFLSWAAVGFLSSVLVFQYLSERAHRVTVTLELTPQPQLGDLLSPTDLPYLEGPDVDALFNKIAPRLGKVEMLRTRSSDSLQLRFTGSTATETTHRARRMADVLVILAQQTQLEFLARRMQEIREQQVDLQQRSGSFTPREVAAPITLIRGPAIDTTLERRLVALAKAIDLTLSPLRVSSLHRERRFSFAEKAAPIRSVITLIFGVAALLWSGRRHFTGHAILSGYELETHCDLPVLGQLPETRRQDRSLINAFMYSPASRLADAVRRLRFKVLPRGTRKSTKLLVFTATRPGEGCSTTALLFAQSVANWGRRVLLIDTDTRGRTLSKRLSGDQEVGILSLLAGVASFHEVRNRPDGLSLDFLPIEAASAHAADVLDTDRLSEFLDWAASEYDHIIIDTPPVATSPETLTVASLADRLLYVVRWQTTPLTAIRQGLHGLRIAGANPSGMVLNRQNIHAMRYLGYGDQNDMHHSLPA